MKKARLPFALSALALCAAFVLACGSSQPRILQSISLSPGTAEGQTQFVATGVYTTSPTTVTPLEASWGACYQNAPTTDITVSSTGAAQCGSTASGTYMVWANDPTGATTCPLVVNACGGGDCLATGTAQLTCP